MRFDLADLQLFLNIADARSITGGARQSNLSLASASERVRGMEKVLGERLLDRSRQGVVPTPAGVCLLEHARLVMQQVARMRGDLAAFARGQAGTVRLLSNTAAIAVHLPRVLASFLASHPSISIEVEERESIDITEAVASGAADVGIASEAAFSAAVKGFAFCDDQLVVVMPRGDALTRSRKVQLMDILERDFVTTAYDSALQCHIAAHAARLGAMQRVRARLNDFDAICGMVATGVGIAIVPEVAARRAKRHHSLEVARLTDPWASRRLAVCVRDVAALPAGTRHLVEHLRAAAPISR
jgi:DNA-binding transcriptional LysR family regulator